MSDGKIHIPAKKIERVSARQQIWVSPEAYNKLAEWYGESTLSMKDLASLIILQAEKFIVFDKEE